MPRRIPGRRRAGILLPGRRCPGTHPTGSSGERIANLEGRIGARLFDRIGRRVRLDRSR
ncbi:MAG: LysR family transcriptional regulator [Arhodomonas sp.]|nr:LysR family transcriptional regulator [Arhodomonas sp.]